jgi:proteic killer suppression protein
MIKTFGDKDTEALFDGKRVRRFVRFENAALVLEDLRVPPGHRLEALKGDRAGQFSIRVNDQFRVCFVWRDEHAYDVEIVDYH